MKKVLLVEDNSPTRQAVLLKLVEQKIQTDVAIDGKEALEKIKRGSYALVIIDLLLPKVSGFEVIRSIRNNAATKNTKVLVFSNLNQDPNIEEAIKAGADAYYVKSDTNIHELIKKIAEMI